MLYDIYSPLFRSFLLDDSIPYEKLVSDPRFKKHNTNNYGYTYEND